MYSFNQCGTKDAMINNIKTTMECPRCSTDIEGWEHIVKCKENRYKR